MIYGYGQSWWNGTDREKPKTSEKACPSASLSTTNLTWTDPGVKPGLRGDRLATNRLSHKVCSGARLQPNPINFSYGIYLNIYSMLNTLIF
jgi:hypothetical protein